MNVSIKNNFHGLPQWQLTFPADTVSINSSLHSIQSHPKFQTRFYCIPQICMRTLTLRALQLQSWISPVLPVLSPFFQSLGRDPQGSTFEITFLCESSGSWNRNNERSHCPACWCSTTTPFQMQQDIPWSLCAVYTAELYWTKRGRSEILHKLCTLQKCRHLLREVLQAIFFI